MSEILKTPRAKRPVRESGSAIARSRYFSVTRGEEVNSLEGHSLGVPFAFSASWQRSLPGVLSRRATALE